MKMHKNGRWKKSVGDMRRRNADEGRGRHRYRSPNRASPPPRHRSGRNNRDASQYSERGRGGGSYCRLIISNIGNKEYPNTIRECLEREFKEYGENMVQVKMDRHGDQIAIATFRSPADARACKSAPGVLELKGRRLQIDALPEDVYDEFHRRSISPAARRSRSPNYFPPRNRGSKMMRNRSDSFEKYGGGGGGRYSKHSPPGRGYLQRGNSRDYTPPRGGKYGRGAAMDYSVSRSPSREYSPEVDSSYAAVVDEPPSNPDFCPPEDDPKATRTLFVGNLEPQVNQNEVRRKFEPFGYIETIDFKKANRDNGGGTYCFVRYGNLDMAYNAKIMLNGKAILQNPMHIGYGKINPSVRVWVGGLGQWTKRGDLEQEFDRFGAIKRIDFHRGESCAAILYETMDAAKEACNQMRGFLMPNALTRLKMDFLDPYSEDSSYRDVAPDQKRRGGDARRNNDYRRGGGGGGSYRGRGRGGYRDGGGGFDRRHKSPDRSGAGGGGSQSTAVVAKKPSGMNLAEQMQFKRERAKSCYDLYGLCYAFKPACWQGGFLLKNIHFPVHFFLLEGDMGVFNTTTADPTSRTGRRVCFNLSHRLKLDPERLETIRHRLERPVCKERTCLILAVPGVPEDLADFENISHKPLRGLVKYFKDKESAAVVKLPLLSRQPVAKDAEGETSKKLSGVLHAFPPSPFVTEQLLKIGPCLQPAQFVDEYLLIYLVKGPQSIVV